MLCFITSEAFLLLSHRQGKQLNDKNNRKTKLSTQITIKYINYFTKFK